MRKSIVAILCLLVVLSLAVCAGAAGLNMTVSAGKTAINRGDKITVTVSVDDFASCKSGSLLVSYNENVFSCSDSKWLLEGLTVNTPEIPAVFAFSSGKDISGKVYQFTLTAKEDAAFSTYDISVTLTLKDVNGNPYTALQSVSIAVECKHEYNSGEVTKEATCTADGTRVRTCKICNATKNETIEKLGHAYDEGEVINPAGCIEVGEMRYRCTRCDKTKTEEIAPTGHSYDNDCDADCNACGGERTVEHNYGTHWTSDASGHWHECIDCGEILEIFPHTPGAEPTETTEQICLDCGYVIQTFKPHEHVVSGDWLGDENSHWYQCQCGENFGTEPHTWDVGTPDEATGTITYHCTTCGYAKTVDREVNDPTESNPDNPDPTQPADDPGDNDDDNNDSVWMIIALILAVLLLAAIAFIVFGFIASKKQTGKFSS